MSEDRLKIALIGSGIGSLAAAKQLYKKHDVTIFEAESHIGGHAYTAPIEINGKAQKIDVGVQVIVPSYYPNIMSEIAALQEEGAKIDLHASSMVIYAAGTDSEGKEVGWGNTAEYQKRPEVRSVWNEETQKNASDFMLRAELMSQKEQLQSIEEWLDTQKVSPEFREFCLKPLMSTVTLTSSGLDRTPFIFITGLFPGMLSFSNATTWFRFNDGVVSFIDALVAPFKDSIRLNSRVEEVFPTADKKVSVRLADNDNVEVFDKVVYGGSLGVLNEANSQILNNPQNDNWATQKAHIQTFKNQDSIMYIHQDESTIPKNCPVDASEIFDERVKGAPIQHDNLSVIYDLPTGAKNPVAWNSLYPDAILPPPDNLLHPAIHWKHEFLDMSSLGARMQLHEIQGLGGVYYCGASAAVPGFEQCFLSGLIVAEHIDSSARYPFSTDPQNPAYQGYQFLSGLMFPPPATQGADSDTSNIEVSFPEGSEEEQQNRG